MFDMFNVLSTGMEIMDSVNIQVISDQVMSLDPVKMGLLASKVVEVNNQAPMFQGVQLSVQEVTPFLTTVGASAETIRQFVDQTLDKFEPFIKGGAIFLTAFKGAGAVFKTLLGEFKRAMEDIKWLIIGLSILGVLPIALDLVSDILFGSME